MTAPLSDTRPFGVVFDRPDADRCYAWGPFSGFDAAAKFAEFVQAEIDPARVLPWAEAEKLPGVRVLDAVTELLIWRVTVALPQAEVRRAELRDRRTEDLNLRGLLAPDGLPRRVPMELGASLVPAVERLLLELDRFREGHRALFALMQDGQHWDGKRLVSEALLSQRDVRRALHWPPPVAPDGPCECKATADGSPIHQADAAAPSSKEPQR